MARSVDPYDTNDPKQLKLKLLNSKDANRMILDDDSHHSNFPDLKF
jgi:hypothetical protein